MRGGSIVCYLVPAVKLLPQPRHGDVHAPRFGERSLGQRQVPADQGGSHVPEDGGEVLQDGLGRLPGAQARIARKGRADDQGHAAAYERLQEPVGRYPGGRGIESGDEQGGDTSLGPEHDSAPDQERDGHRQPHDDPGLNGPRSYGEHDQVGYRKAHGDSEDPFRGTL